VSWDRWHRDPREGEAPLPVCCDHGIDLSEADCYACMDDDRCAATCAHGHEHGLNCETCQAAAYKALARAFIEALRRVEGVAHDDTPVRRGAATS